MSSITPPPVRRGPGIRLALLLVTVIAAVVVVVVVKSPRNPPVPLEDPDAALGHNTRGVALMEQRKDAEAEVEFARAVALAPNWLPARINQGIALFNQQPADTKELAVQVKKAQQVFADVLARETDNTYAHYCLGMIDMYVGQYPAAYPRFQVVNRLDPEDAHTWLRLGSTHPDGPDSPAAGACYEMAVALDPYLIEAKYKLFICLREKDPKRAETLLTEHELLREADRFTESRIVYGEMGKYAEVIGRDPKATGPPRTGPVPNFVPEKTIVEHANGVTWATRWDPLRKAARDRFGGTVVLFDYNGDGKPDVFLPSSVIENGTIRDVLLRNDGAGRFTDVTKDVGLASDRFSLGAAAADFDNDGKPDLAVTTANGVRLFRNAGGRFEDVTAAAGLEAVKGVCLGCTWADLDLDGDLDLIVCQYGEAAKEFDKPDASGGVWVFENVGIAPPADPRGPTPPLSTAFKSSEAFRDIFPKGPAVAVIATDVDDDHDQDLVALFDGVAPVVAMNDRLMRWHKGSLSGWPGVASRWNGGLVFDANCDGRSDLLLVRAGEPAVLLISKGRRDFAVGRLDASAYLHATAADVDLDGWPDAIGVSGNRVTTVLHNLGTGDWEFLPTPRNPDSSPAPVAVAVGDMNGDGRPDVLVLHDGGFVVHSNRGENHPLVVAPTGRRDKGSNLRTSQDGFGTWIVAQSGRHGTGAERTTLTAGLGQSLLPTIMGMGRYETAEALRVRWPDNVIQAELDVPTGTPYRLTETNRKGTSCPVLLSWDGERFVFVTDFLGAGRSASAGRTGPSARRGARSR